ncbi:pyruvate formate lyase family protein [Methanobrevibacter ruminantium]|uniref:pyruvate formate lyase family protein n=1 Tax=Methanobrevibacter ruminantium TaxID=83816 RepID=UPI002D7E5D7A|nr:pyruvate formate lyase family protein [Methanobrevibacter ruminantium]
MGLFDNIRSLGGRKSNNSRPVIYASTISKLNRKFKNREKATSYLASNMHNFYISSSKFNKGLQIKNLFRKVEIELPDDGFIYFLDELKNLNFDGKVLNGVTVDYSKILSASIYDYNEIYFHPKGARGFARDLSSDFNNDQLDMLDGIELLIYEISKKLRVSNHSQRAKFARYFEDMIDKKAEHFEEALQRILFFNQLLWQTGHNSNGLGRLDKILEDYYFDDMNSGVLSQEEAYDLINDFLKILHSYYWYKSDEFLGDTGQIIVLGGKYADEYGEYYFYNDLTYMFIQAINELQLPDPKIVLRVSNETPRDLMELSLETLNTGIGSPLFSNDEVIIDKLVEFGYSKGDAANYVVSDCGQPSIVGSDLGQNNIKFLSFLKPLNDFFDSETDRFLDNVLSFDELLNSYKYYLKRDAELIISSLDSIEWNEDPLISLFTDDCNDNSADISKCGARYNDYGITTLGLANAVNSLYNIKRLVFEEKRYTLNELNKMRKNNFKKDRYHATFNELKNMRPCFGLTNKEILDIENEIVLFLEDCLKDYANEFGGKIKFGLSGSSHISAGRDTSASFDGRKDGEALSCNISFDSNRDFTEIFGFASKLDYGGCKINGNMIDLIFPSNYIKNNIDNFSDFIYSSINSGIFQLQINVLSSKVLIEAKEDTLAYPNLIVRVSGFSSYFNDLPEEYQDFLIGRALMSEGK